MADFKQWREEKRTMLKDVVPLQTPFNIQVETSSLCNFRCIYCAHANKDHGVWEGNMSMELFHHVLHDIAEFPQKVKLIEMFSFGEPLCQPHLAEMIREVREANICDRIDFTTNGALLTPSKIDAILSAGVDTIRISIQGLDAAAYEKICGVHIDFDQFLNNLSYLYAHRGMTKIRIKIADIALKGIPNGRNQFEQLFGDKADSIFIEHILPMYQSIDYDEIDADIRKNAINGRENVRQTDIHKVCHRPFYRLRVAANGLVCAACCDSPNDIKYGDIHENSLVNLWNGGGHSSFLKMHLQGRRFQHPVCSTCMLPNDITNEADLLDPYAEEILKRF